MLGRRGFLHASHVCFGKIERQKARLLSCWPLETEAWFHKKPSGCINGAACKRCHLCPEGEPKLRKKQYPGEPKRRVLPLLCFRYMHSATCQTCQGKWPAYGSNKLKLQTGKQCRLKLKRKRKPKCRHKPKRRLRRKLKLKHRLKHKPVRRLHKPKQRKQRRSHKRHKQSKRRKPHKWHK